MNKKEVVKSEGISLKITPDFLKRLDDAAGRIGISRSALAELAIEAAVHAIEANGNQLVLPLQFNVKQVPTFSFLNKEESNSVWREKVIAEVARYNRESGVMYPLALMSTEPHGQYFTEEELDIEKLDEQIRQETAAKAPRDNLPTKP